MNLTYGKACFAEKEKHYFYYYETQKIKGELALCGN